MEKIKILIIDDSAIVRDILEERLSGEHDIEVIGTAIDPYIGRDKIVKLKPDVVTLDIEMPKMDGLTFLNKLMTYYPIPVIIVSSVTTNDSTAAIKALEIGAFDVVNKPGSSISVESVIEELLRKIRAAYEHRSIFLTRREMIQKSLFDKQQVAKTKVNLAQFKTTDKLIVIGSSTGGTLAIEFLLQNLPDMLPPIVIVQHMPPVFTRNFAERLNQLTSLAVKETEDGEIITAGTVYIARGGCHTTLNRKGANLYIKHTMTEKENFQRPSVDVLFRSVAEVAGKNVIALILTGMGKDGAKGLLALKNAGSYTIAQDEKTSLVWGMPREATDMGAASEVVSLNNMPRTIINFVKK